MFKILDGRSQFYQWDLDRKLIVEDASIKEVHFCNRTDECSLVCEVYRLGNQRVVDVPNILLQENWRINVYAYDSNYTKHCEVFEVIKRSRPADYVYTETEIMKWSELDARIDQIEDKGVSDEKISSAVNDYLAANPIESPVESVNGKTGAVELTAEDVGALPADTVLPDTTGLATEKYVDEKIQEAQLSGGDVEVDLSNYYTKSETDEKIKAAVDAIEIPEAGETDLSNYYTKSEVDALIPAAPDLSNYALKTEIPDVSAYQTAEQVQAAITSALGNIANAEEGAY